MKKEELKKWLKWDLEEIRDAVKDFEPLLSTNYTQNVQEFESINTTGKYEKYGICFVQDCARYKSFCVLKTQIKINENNYVLIQAYNQHIENEINEDDSTNITTDELVEILDNVIMNIDSLEIFDTWETLLEC